MAHIQYQLTKCVSGVPIRFGKSTGEKLKEREIGGRSSRCGKVEVKRKEKKNLCEGEGKVRAK